MKRLFACLFCLGVLAAPMQTYARTEHPAATAGTETPAAPTPTTSEATDAPTLESLTAEVDALKKKATAWEKIRAHLPRFSGYIQLRYDWSENKSDFSIKRARLDLKGDIISKIDYRMQIDFANSVKLVDAFINYKPFNEFKIKLGQFKIPFSIETDFSPNKLEFTDYALPLRKLMAYSDVSGLKASGRDLGLEIHGGFLRQDDGRDLIGYDVAVLNGQGINTSDANKSKDIAARLMLRPVAGLTVSGSYYRGEYGKGHLLRQRYSAGVSFDRNRWVARGEWFGGRTGTDEGSRFDSDGWYAVVGFRATKTLMPALHCESFTENTDIRSETCQTNYGAGLVWQPIKYLRCQLNYNWQDMPKGVEDSNAVVVMVTGMF